MPIWVAFPNQRLFQNNPLRTYPAFTTRDPFFYIALDLFQCWDLFELFREHRFPYNGAKIAQGEFSHVFRVYIGYNESMAISWIGVKLK